MISNHKQHDRRIERYQPESESEALSIILALNKSDFNNYNQMVKDIMIICERGLNE